MRALLFGSIGTLIETSNIQRESFNQAFKEIGLDWHWDQESYKKLLKKSGGTKRIEDFAQKNNVNVDAKKERSGFLNRARADSSLREPPAAGGWVPPSEIQDSRYQRPEIKCQDMTDVRTLSSSS